MKTKSRILAVAIIALSMISIPSFSQVKFGVKGEVGLNSLAFSSNMFTVEHMNAFKVGPSIEFIHPTVGLGLEGSLLYSNEKMTVKDFVLDQTLFEVANHNITLPINLKYKLAISSPFKVYLAAGPYLQFNVAGDEFDWEKIAEGVRDTFEEKNFGAGLNAGLGIELFNSIQLGVNYRLTLTDNYAVNLPDWELLNENKGFWSISVGVYL